MATIPSDSAPWRFSLPFSEAGADEEAPPFDPKVAFKSRTGVMQLETSVLRSIRADARRAARREEHAADALTLNVPPVR